MKLPLLILCLAKKASTHTMLQLKQRRKTAMTESLKLIRRATKSISLNSINLNSFEALPVSGRASAFFEVIEEIHGEYRKQKEF